MRRVRLRRVRVRRVRVRGANAGAEGRVLRRVTAGAGSPPVVLAFRRPELVAGLVLVDPGHEEMEGFLPQPFRWGWRIVRTVFRDELHCDAPVTLAALRELRAADSAFPDVPVVVLSASRGFPRPFRAHWTSSLRWPPRRGPARPVMQPVRRCSAKVPGCRCGRSGSSTGASRAWAG